VVIAIIGILSSVVLASLNTARGKGANAAVKSNLSNIRAMAELFYDSQSPNTYGTFALAACPTASVAVPGHMFVSATVVNAITAAKNAAGDTTNLNRCIASATAPGSWAASVPLKVNEGTFTTWCVDSTGASTGRATAITTSAC
jgi:type II secretory pathway pseudopilin PulG